MKFRVSGLQSIVMLSGLSFAVGCGPGVPGGGGTGGAGTSVGTGGSSATGSGGSSSGTGGAATGTGGAPLGTGGAVVGTGGTPGTAGRGSGGTPGTAGRGTGGTTTGTGGRGTGGTTPTGGAGGGMSTTVPTPLDCGPIGWAVENHGPPANRVNYGILGDGYLTADLGAGGVFEQHIQKYMTKRFSAVIGQPYGRYRNFINICAIKLVSTGAICGSSALGCCGDNTSRLAQCNSTAASTAFSQNLPASFMMDWRAIMLNGSSWWNTGAALMLWSGGNTDAAGAALHEGGHGFHALADEYGTCTGACGMNTMGTGTAGGTGGQVNMCGDPVTTDGKWPMWVGYDHVGATGMQGTWTGGANGRYKPSNNSMMNSLFGNNVNTSFNPVSREKIVMDIWQRVVPIDSTVPPAGAVSGAMPLVVNVIDPAVINVDWTVDGTTTVNGGTTLSTANLAAGSHTITAKAYDNAGTDLVRQVPGTTFGRQYWARSVQTVTWTVTIP